MKLSVIVAAYNVEKYIVECIRSVTTQLDLNAELIIVNDGSTDKTSTLIEEEIDRNKNMNITHHVKTNGGLSDARNEGIELAKGEYLAFLDGDDIWMRDYYSEIMKCLDSKNSPDIIEYDFVRSEDFKDNLEYFKNTRGKNNGTSTNDYIITTIKNANWHAWSRVYKRELFEEIRYPLNKRFEDFSTTPLLFSKVKSFHLINKALIGYRKNNGSITMNIKESDVDDIYFGLERVINSKLMDRKNLELFLVSSSEFIKYINYVLSPFDYRITSPHRKLIRKNTSFNSKMRSVKNLAYIYAPLCMVLLSDLRTLGRNRKLASIKKKI